MANYGTKQFSRYKQILCKVEGKKIPPCEQDIKDVIAAWEKDKSFYESDISDYERGIINIWAYDDESTDDDLGIEQLQHAADMGNAKAMNLCAMAHHLIVLQGKPVLEEDVLEDHKKAAIKYWKMGAELKQCEALCNLALCYLEGTYVERDLSRAKELFKKAEKAHHPSARKYYKEAGLNKWDEGEKYDEDPLSLKKAISNSYPKKEKKSVNKVLKERALTAYAKTQRVSLKEAMKVISDEYQGYKIVDCVKHDFCFVFSLIKMADIGDDSSPKHWDYDQYHYMFDRITKEISTFSAENYLYSVEMKHANFETYLSKEDLLFVKRFGADSFLDDTFE